VALREKVGSKDYMEGVGSGFHIGVFVSRDGAEVRDLLDAGSVLDADRGSNREPIHTPENLCVMRQKAN
jgi:hypothetical protein